MGHDVNGLVGYGHGSARWRIGEPWSSDLWVCVGGVLDIGVDLGLYRDAAVSVEEGIVSDLLLIPLLPPGRYGR